MFADSYEADAALTATWHTWTRKQMDVVGKDMVGISKFVFSDKSDKSGMRSALLERAIPCKSEIAETIDN
eukprot:403941-Rhodomonas_salina.1